MYSRTLPSTSALDGVGGQSHAPGRFIPGKGAGSHCIGGWVDHRVENLASIGIRSPDRPAHSESLYRLCYPGPP